MECRKQFHILFPITVFMFARKTTNNQKNAELKLCPETELIKSKLDKEITGLGGICLKVQKLRFLTKADSFCFMGFLFVYYYYFSAFGSSTFASLSFVDCHNSEMFPWPLRFVTGQ